MHAAVLVVAAVVGTGLAAYVDVETTEIPDSYGLVMAGIGLLTHIIHGFATGSYTALVTGVITGVIFAGIGYGLYRAGAWGGADAVLLAAVGVLTPGFTGAAVYPAAWPVAFTFFVNLWMVGAAYELVYVAVLLTSLNVDLPGVTSVFTMHRGRVLWISAAYVAAAAVSTAIAAWFLPVSPGRVAVRFAMFTPVVLVFLGLFNGLKWVEEHVMRYDAAVGEVERGDMLAEDVEVDGEVLSAATVRGLTREEVERLQVSEVDTVTLRTGVSFAPVFPLAILLTVYFGDVLLFAAT